MAQINMPVLNSPTGHQPVFCLLKVYKVLLCPVSYQ